MQTDISRNTNKAEPFPATILPPREEFTQPWRWLTFVAGLLLAATFFVPYAEQTNIRRIAGRRTTTAATNQLMISVEPAIDSPCAIWGQLINSFATSDPNKRYKDLFNMTSLLVLGTFPPFWGFAIAFYSLSQLFGLDRFRRIISRTGTAASLAAGLLLIAAWLIILVQTVGIPAPSSARMVQAIYYAFASGIIVLFIMTPIINALYAARYGRWTYLYQSFIIAFLLACPLGLRGAFLAVRSQQPYGLTLFIIASCLLLFASIGEARAVSRLSWFWTIVGLFVLRLHRWAFPPGHCPACGYNLHALPELRCPECGRPFTPAEAAPQSATSG
jgi:hypothetical protein